MKVRGNVLVATISTILMFMGTANGQGVVFSGAVVGGVSGVKNQPFSADVVWTTDQTLADGNRIHQETHGKSYRDSEGRQRTEREFIAPGGERHSFITMFDPIRRANITLNDTAKTATINYIPEPSAHQNMAAIPPEKAATPQNLSRIQVTREDLGTQAIEGLLARGSRVTRITPAGVEGNELPLISVSETWTTVDMHLIVES